MIWVVSLALSAAGAYSVRDVLLPSVKASTNGSLWDAHRHPAPLLNRPLGAVSTWDGPQPPAAPPIPVFIGTPTTVSATTVGSTTVGSTTYP